ncbi:hypothetical protein STCU_05190 [Strigomonas culicis]|uniref:Transmembrane protein 135 N-terminal domain-containing protein n=1 Tax=Strigomonas culicis TaxID=28005 RepID=S9UHS9_9TRYP|nr:hypothetical protein STCU_05206 [Strigomonas culicis]EPY28320.1 hypothetical protein STCU_05190 [Strigomonas culicis]|eukprot:EPY28289.1 hypothetical protein STCU_05206 [Strigomonas culicis]
MNNSFDKDSKASRALVHRPERHHLTGEEAEAQYRSRLSKRHTLRIALRNGLYAAIGRILIGILKQLAKKGLSRAFLQRVRGEVLSLDPIKWAFVFGGFSCYRLCVQLLTRLADALRLPHKSVSFFSGCICSLPALVMNKTTRTELSLYMFVRAAHAFALRFVLPRLPLSLQRFDHYDTLLMCLSSVQICYGCMFAPFTMPPSYQNFLSQASTYDRRFFRAYIGYMRGHTAPEMVDLSVEKGWELFNGHSQESVNRLCEYTHKGYTCNGWILHFIPINMLRVGIPLYGPLKFFMLVTGGQKKLRQHPTTTLLRALKSVLTSALFLALYVSIFIRSACFSIHMGYRGGLRTSLLGSLAGLATLLEPKGRRMDLALYCAMYALRSFLLTQNRLGHLPYPRHWFVFSTYLASMGFMLYEYEEEPKLLNPRVRSAMKLLLGERAGKSHVSRLGAGHADATPEKESEAKSVA